MAKWDELTEPERTEQVANQLRKQERDIKSGKETCRMLTAEETRWAFECQIFRPRKSRKQ
jgi:hypothetical protein